MTILPTDGSETYGEVKAKLPDLSAADLHQARQEVQRIIDDYGFDPAGESDLLQAIDTELANRTEPKEDTHE